MKTHIAALGLATVFAVTVSPASDYCVDSLTGLFGDETGSVVKTDASSKPAAPVGANERPAPETPTPEKPVASADGALLGSAHSPQTVPDASPVGEIVAAPSIPVAPSSSASPLPSVEETLSSLPEVPSLSSIRDSLGSLLSGLGGEDAEDSVSRNSFRVKYLSGEVSHEGLSYADALRRRNYYHWSYHDHERKDDLSGFGADARFFFRPWLGVEASALHADGRLKSGSIYLDRRYYFEDSKTRHTDLRAGVVLKAFPDRAISPFAVAGIEKYKYKTDYAYTVTYWYWSRSGRIVRADRNKRHGSFYDDGTGVYVDVGLDIRFGPVRAKAGASLWNVADTMDSAWEDGHHASPVCPFAEVSVSVFDTVDIGLQYSEIPVSDFKYFGVSLGISF